MDELARFLARLGLRQHEAAFRDNDVDLDILRVLSEADLKELGLSLGHRRKLLAALAEDVAPAPDDGAPAEPPFAGGEAAGRRQLTVMFCDLVGSTALAAALDPERMEQLLRAYQDACVGEIARFGGFVERYMGDGVLAYFGYPRADEDAAERAVRAALGIVGAVKRVPSPTGAPLAVRIGIASGLVVARGPAQRAGVSEPPVTGETVNLAARLQACAGADGVVVAAATRRLVGALFELEDLGESALKGMPGPARVWRVVRERPAATRFEATHPAGGAEALVGRDQEVALLLDRWELAKAGDGQVVLLSGEAGIGKSRIGQALCERIAADRHRAVRYQCSPFHVNSALQPVIAHLEHACGIGREDSAEAKLGKLERFAKRLLGDVPGAVPLLAALLGIPAEGRHPPLALSPEQQKERLLGLVAGMLTGGARPVLLLVEDAHWIDPTTRELLGLCIDRVAASRCLVLVTFRPGFRHEWSGRWEVTGLALNRIGRRQSAELIGLVAGGKALPPEVLEQIVTKTDGVPLFIEELTKAVLESGLLEEDGDRYSLAGPLPPLAIPATLQDSLLARLDRLGAAKEVAQVGAALGREFPYGAAAALSSLRGAAFDQALRQLVAAELVHQRGVPPRATYAFKHALVQDAAYGTILLSKRQQLHARCAEVLQESSPELAETKPEVLAHHCTEAGLAERAVGLWLAAGQRACERSANLEAIGHLTRGLAVLDGLPPGEARYRRELLLQNGLGMPFIAARGYAAPETGAAFQRARELAERLGDRAQLIRALYGLWAYRVLLGEVREAEALASLLLRHATEAGEQAVALVARRALGMSRYLLGDQAGGRAAIEAALQAYDPSVHRPLAYRFGQDQRVACLALLSVVQWIEGQPDQALRTSRGAVEAAREVEHANSLGYALAYGGCHVPALRGDWAEVERRAAELIGHARDHRLGLWHAHGLAYRAEALAQRGELAAGIAGFRAALAGFGEVAARLRVPAHQAAFASALARAGQLHEALAVAEDALRQAEEREERWCLPELLRIRSEVLLARGSEVEAEAGLLRAVEVSRAQGMRGWELRAALGLGALWRGLGREPEAFGLVSGALAPFAEGAATVDVVKAKRLLVDLKGGPAREGARRPLGAEPVPAPPAPPPAVSDGPCR
jgi:class 3 adenylate cyclase/predicted ATPase